MNDSFATLILNILGITCLLAGTTVAARIPRLTRVWWWRLTAAVLFVVFAALYVFLVDAPTRAWLGLSRGEPPPSVDAVWKATAVTLALALGIVLFSSLSWKLKVHPEWLAPLLRGVRPLTVPGSIAVVLLIARRVYLDNHHGRSLWPLLLSSAIFLYLWWLTIRLFDLVFVWHRYTRGAVIQKHLGPKKATVAPRETTSGEERELAGAS